MLNSLSFSQQYVYTVSCPEKYLSNIRSKSETVSLDTVIHFYILKIAYSFTDGIMDSTYVHNLIH